MEETELEDDRLYLRPFRLGDADEVYQACQDPDIQKWTLVPVPYTREDAVTFTNEFGPSGWRDGTQAIFAVIDKSADRLLASVSLGSLRELEFAGGGQGDLGYWTAPWARGRNVMTDSGRLVCRWGIQSLGLARINWYAEVGNVGSRRVAEKIGFSVEGVMRRYLIHRGERRDAWVGGLLRGELR